MRADMAKVLCERPRGGLRRRRRGYQGPIEDAPNFESTRRRRDGTKHLNEHLGPLRRWLLAQVGRRWDDVYSELRARISPRNAVQMHIWQHAADYVERQVVLRGQIPHHPTRVRYRDGTTRLDARRCPVYVCPRTGMLRATPVEPRKRR